MGDWAQAILTMVGGIIIACVAVAQLIFKVNKNEDAINSLAEHYVRREDFVVGITRLQTRLDCLTEEIKRHNEKHKTD